MLFEKVDMTKLSMLEYLPVFHTMRARDIWNPGYGIHREEILDWDKRAIVSDERCQKCDVFSENLIYCFYGRPAFQWEEPNNNLNPYPVFFVFDGKAIHNPNMIFPFDTGAYNIGLYGKAYSSSEVKNYQLADERIGHQKDEIPLIISLLWGSNMNYSNATSTFDSKTLINAHPEFSLFDREYVEFVLNGKNSSGLYCAADSRAMTIEFIYRDILHLQALKEVIVPDSISDEDRNCLFKALGSSIMIHQLPYDYRAVSGLNSFFSQFFEYVRANYIVKERKKDYDLYRCSNT